MARPVGLDVPAIVDAALAIADADGIERLTMRRLSTALDVTPMAIYHHVEGKEGLLDLVVDQSLEGLPGLDREQEPRQRLRRFFLGLHRLLVDHPALAQAMATRPLEGPVATRTAERALAALRECGLSEPAAVEAFVSGFSFTLGASLYRVSRDAVLGRRTFAGVDEGRTPTVHQARQRLNEITLDDDHFLRSLDRLLVPAPNGAAERPVADA